MAGPLLRPRELGARAGATLTQALQAEHTAAPGDGGLHPRRWAREEPGRIAAVFEPSGRTLTYGRLAERSARGAHLLRELGVDVGDHVALLMENHPAFLEVAWAAQDAGVLFTPVSWRFHPDEVGFILRDCGARALFVTAAQLPLLEPLRADLHGVAVVVVEGVDRAAPGDLDYDAALARQPDSPPPDGRRGADMVYSSGSTGRPKGVRQKLPDLATDTLSPLFAVFAERWGWDRGTTYLMPAPLYHSGPLRFAMAMQHVGATLVVMERFDPAHALELIARRRVTHAHFVPTMLVRLLKLPPSVREGADLSSLRMIIHGAAPCAPEVKRAMIDWVGPILEESYGGSEGNGMTIISSAEWLEHPGSVGRAFAGRIDILNEAGRVLPPGGEGLVYFSGGPGFEYHGAEALTRGAHDGEGRSTLGDIGRLDADGYLYLTDRRSHMIITGGVNVFPQEIENVLIMHPEVVDVAVFGVPDADLGERIQAVVQPRDPAHAGEALAEELRELCRSRLARFKTPRDVAFRDALPRHDTGKIYTRLLKAEFAGGNA